MTFLKRENSSLLKALYGLGVGLSGEEKPSIISIISRKVDENYRMDERKEIRKGIVEGMIAT